VLCLPDAVSYLRRAIWFFVVATVCFVLQYVNPVWLWIALSTVVVGQMFHGSWVWHASVAATDEDREIGDVAVYPDRSGNSRRALQRWFRHVSRLSRWTFLSFYIVMTVAAWLADPGFPWVLFASLAAALWVMPPGLTGITSDLAGKVSLALQHFVGVVALIACPLFLGVMLNHFAGAKGFLIGTALGALILVVGLITVGMLARSPIFLQARLGVLQCRYRLLPAFVLHFGRRW
jgi:magnesium-transporting ATPase (P-type)